MDTFLDELNSPIIYGILGGILVYLFLYYKKKDKKNKINIIIPIACTIIFWFLAFCFLSEHKYQKTFPLSVYSDEMTMSPSKPLSQDTYLDIVNFP